jgi:hypothetical protein
MGVSKVGPGIPTLGMEPGPKTPLRPDYQSCTDRATPPDCGVRGAGSPGGRPRAVVVRPATGQLQAYLRRSWPR